MSQTAKWWNGKSPFWIKIGFILLVGGGLARQPAYPQVNSSTEEPSGTLKVNVELVNLFFTVADGKQLVTSLNQNDFQVEEDNKRQSIQRFSREVTLPLTLAILVDSSPSVEPILGLEKQTAIEFLHNVLRKDDLAMIMNFDRSVNLLQDFTAQLGLLEKGIKSIRIGGGTSIHDAVFLACDEKLKYEAGRKAIILISDGADTTSKIKMREAMEAAQKADVIIYAISDRAGGSFYSAYERDDGTLKQYAEATGGRAFFPSKPQELKKAFDEIQEELRSQYSLAYSSTNLSRDGSFRTIKLTVLSQKNLKVRVRKGYYAPRS